MQWITAIVFLKLKMKFELAVSQMRDDPEAIRKLDPFNNDSFADDWLNRNLVTWGQTVLQSRIIQLTG